MQETNVTSVLLDILPWILTTKSAIVSYNNIQLITIIWISYYNLSSFLECDCSDEGSSTCDAQNGSCQCKEGYSGNRCDACDTGFYVSGTNTNGENICTSELLFISNIVNINDLLVKT